MSNVDLSVYIYIITQKWILRKMVKLYSVNMARVSNWIYPRGEKYFGIVIQDLICHHRLIFKYSLCLVFLPFLGS